MLSLDEILSVANQGRTKPFLRKGSDGKMYYAKGKGATPSGLIKEWMAANLAQAFGLPIPNFQIAYVDSILVESYGDEAVDSLGFGEVFVSEQIESATDFKYPMLKQMPDELQRDILFFDLWIENADRTLSENYSGNPNLVWNSSDSKAYIIDHNLAFDDDFDLTLFWQTHVCQAKFSNSQLDITEKEQLETKLQYSLEQWDSWWNKIPEEWIQQNEDSMLFEANKALQRLQAEAQGEIWTKWL